MRKRTVLLLALLLPGVGYVHAKDWEKVRQQGQMQLVLVSKSREGSRDVYASAVRTLCSPGQRCHILFWSDRSMLPKRLPMTAAELAAQTGSYTRNPSTGVDELVLLCRYGKNGGKCLR